MNIERILVYVDPDRVNIRNVEWIITLAEFLSARLIFLAVIENAEELSDEEYDKTEDRFWKYLYELEDIAFEKEVKVSLVIEEGDTFEVVKRAIKGYRVQAFVTFLTSKLNIEKFVREIEVPLILLKAGVK